jgi:replicative DNA helicase
MARKRNDIVLSPLEDGNQKYAIRSNADFVVLAGPTGSGKEMPLDEPVLTVDGWKKMGDIRVGDELPAPLNREPSLVTGIYPQGVKPIYKITTSDGRTTRCGWEHLWRI